MSESIDIDDKMPTTVKHDLVNLDSVFDNTNTVRDTVLKKLEPIIQNMIISEDSPKLIEAQMGIINTYLGVLNGKETNISKRVTSKLKLAETETASKHSASVVELLSKISTQGIYNIPGAMPVSQSTIDQEVEDAFTNSGLDPILDTELKTDPKDLDH